MKKGMMVDYVRLLKLENAELRKLSPVNLTLEKQKQYWLKAFRKEQYLGNSLFDAMMCRIEEISKEGSPEQQATILELKSVVEGASKTVHRQHNEIAELKAEATRRKDDVVELHEALSQWEDYFFILGDQCIYDSRTMAGKLSDASKDLEDMKADMAIDYAELKEEYRQILEDFKAKNVKLENDLFRSEGKIKTLEESTVDPKVQLLLGAEVTGLKAKVVQLEGEIEKHLKTIGELGSKNEGLKKSKEEAFKEDRKQIAEEIEKAEQSAPKKKSSTTGENTPKTKAKSIGENTITILGIKNKLCNKGYEVQDTGKSLLAKKPGNRHIEVKHAELPGSFRYIICGQTCYEFDQALKASAYGAKAITPKIEAEAIS